MARRKTVIAEPVAADPALSFRAGDRVGWRFAGTLHEGVVEALTGDPRNPYRVRFDNGAFGLLDDARLTRVASTAAEGGKVEIDFP